MAEWADPPAMFQNLVEIIRILKRGISFGMLNLLWDVKKSTYGCVVRGSKNVWAYIVCDGGTMHLDAVIK